MKKGKHKGKFLALLLRHQPEVGNLTLDQNGWANVKEVLSVLEIDKKELQDIVIEDDKGRYEFSSDQRKIRARQGHSINVDVELKKFIPNKDLYHGTIWKSVQSILNSELKSMSRLYVHLSKDIETAIKVGSRKGTPIILKIDAVKAYTEGIVFFESNNGVILVHNIPAKYITFLK